MIIVFFILYHILHVVALPFFFVYLLIRKFKKKEVFGNVWHRLGIVPQSHKKTVWVHAVSVGEVLSAQKLVEDIKNRFPDYACYFTVGTSGGYQMACQFIKADYRAYLPFDFLPCMLIAFRRINPVALIIIEADFWPNLLMVATYKHIPLFAVNARMSKQVKGIKLFGAKLLRPLLTCFNHLYVQSQGDYEGFIEAGVGSSSLTVLGNLKAYNVIDKRDETLAKGFYMPSNREEPYKIIVCGSIHPGELDGALSLFSKLKKNDPLLKCIIAPRHFLWKDELINKVREWGYSYALWDDGNDYSHSTRPLSQLVDEIFAHHDILLVCTMGLLFYLYPVATLFILGGTFVDIGGHNLLEPAVWGTPALVGPYHYNCTDIMNYLLPHGAVLSGISWDDAYQKALIVLSDRVMCKQIGRKAQGWLEEEAKKVEKSVNTLLNKVS